ncbi:MAG: hypothetical protein WC356_07180 [Candidatus Micrarchaeia archaeon]|jgi:hypothetical protein
MGKALHVITGGLVAAPAAPGLPIVMVANDSLTMRESVSDARIRLLSVWAFLQTGGMINIASPLLHDQLNALNFLVPAAETEPLFAPGISQEVKSEDTLAVNMSGTAAALDQDNVSLLLQYDDMKGIDSQLFTFDEIKDKIKNLKTLHTTHVCGVAGGYSGAVLLNAAANVGVLKGNTKYALLGLRANLRCQTIGITGPDTGNLRIGCPGNIAQRTVAQDWFKKLSLKTGLATIPVIDSANIASTMIDIVNNENALTVIVSSLWAELST